MGEGINNNTLIIAALTIAIGLILSSAIMVFGNRYQFTSGAALVRHDRLTGNHGLSQPQASRPNKMRN